MTALAFLVGIVLIVVGLAVSIALHELGHLLPAKAFGVRVGQYMIGFGPTVFSRRRGETEYGVKAIPLGGYISMAGMYPHSRVSATAGVTATAAGDDVSAEAPDRRQGFFSTMVQDAQAANDETIDEAGGRGLFHRLPMYKRIIIMLGGPLMNLVLAIVLFTIALSGIGVQTATTAIAQVKDCVPVADVNQCAPGDPASPARAAGLKAGDVLVAIDGEKVDDFAQAAQLIQDAPGRTLSVLVDRDGHRHRVQLTPASVDGPDGTTIGVAGILSQVEYRSLPITTGAQVTLANTAAVAQVVVALPQKMYGLVHSMVTGQPRDPDSPLSPVGVGVLAGQAASAQAPVLDRVAFLLQLLAALNVSLFVFNLVPLLPLDGGHIAVALWDGLKRLGARLLRRPPPRPADATRLMPLTFAVVIVLIAIAVVLVVADVVDPLSLTG